MPNYVNPLASLASFRNQELGATINRSTGAGAGVSATAAQRMAAGRPSEGATLGLQGAKNAASRQHELKLAAIQSRIAKEQAAAAAKSAAAASSSGGGTGALKGLYGLSAGAGGALSAMSAAFKKQFGSNLVVNEGGRTRERQAYLYNLYLQGKGNLAAKPGHSLHEKGTAVDFGGAIQNANSREHKWLQANAGRWGFKWTGKNFSQFEPWHWEWHG